jgi:hypothetical protein
MDSSMTRARSLRAIGALLLATVVAGRVAATASAGDHEDRERELKAIGVDDVLRARVHRAIATGAHWLAAQQGRDGSFSVAPAGFLYGTGYTALAALALAHEGSPASVAAAKRAAKWMLVDDVSARAATRGETYTAGLAGLLAADPACGVPVEAMAELAKSIAAGQDASSGWWSYGLGRVPASRRRLLGDGPGRENLSTTQFAALGAWGLSRAGVPVPLETWRAHARGLCRAQAENGSWAYAPSRARSGYPNGTYMGLANLLIAEEALRDKTDVELAREIAAAKARGLGALRRDVASWLQLAATFASSRSHRGNWFLDPYGLYAMEKACIFAGVETVAGESWYARGARLCVDLQRDDGSWDPGEGRLGSGNLVSTAFVLLFLCRSPERYRPTTPTEPAPAPPPSKPTTPSDPLPKGPTTPSR